jgi:hypothetical protein
MPNFVAQHQNLPQNQPDHNQVFSPSSSFAQNYNAHHSNQNNLHATVSNMNINNQQQQFQLQTGHLFNHVHSNNSTSELNNQQTNQYDLINHQHQQQQFQKNN